jgi:hypothetical protein
MASTSGSAVAMVIPIQSGEGVTVAAPPLSSAGKEREIVPPESPCGGPHGSSTWSELERE